MEYNKKTGISGKWAKGSELGNVRRAKIVSETKPESSQYKNKDGSTKFQDVCKVQFEGVDEVLNLSLNRATINALIDAFGPESKGWMNQMLSVETEKVRVAGKAAVAIYLIPEGFEKVDDEDGFAVILRKGENLPPSNLEDDLAEVPEF